jgi:RecB family exonuclease
VDERWWAAVRTRHPFVEDTEARLERERESATRCLASATASLTVTVSVTSSAGTRERHPAPVVADAASAALGRIVTPTDIRNSLYPKTVRGRSPLAASVGGPVIDAFEHELRDAVAARQAGSWTVEAGHRLARPVELRRMRRAPRLTEWDGLVQPDIPLLPEGRQLSATSVEAYGTCGFRFFLRSILRLQALDEPEERQTMDPAMRGTIVHKALDRFFKSEQTRGRPAAGERWNTDDEHELLAILDEEVARASARGRAGLPIFHAHEMATLHADLERFLKEDSLHRLTLGAAPVAFEWGFEGVQIGGRAFRGSADRVDRSVDGKRAWIIDYKTGRSEGYTESDNDPFNGGTQLQLGIYAAALSSAEDIEVTGRYWFITQRGEFAAVEYTHSVANAERLDQVVRAIETGVSGGAFPAVPGEEDPRGGFENCTYCDFDRVCSRRRLAEFTNRAMDESVRPWARVQEIARGNGDD